MSEPDPLNSILREWEAPSPSAGLDARVRSAFHASRPLPWWRRILSARITIPVPAFAALLLLIGVWWFGNRSTPAAEPAPPPPLRGYLSEVNSAGFQPLPNGAIRIVRAPEVKK